jgi:hypothetical protein
MQNLIIKHWNTACDFCRRNKGPVYMAIIAGVVLWVLFTPRTGRYELHPMGNTMVWMMDTQMGVARLFHAGSKGSYLVREVHVDTPGKAEGGPPKVVGYAPLGEQDRTDESSKERVVYLKRASPTSDQSKPSE